jgi:chaperonin cofactor prefoldin
MKSPNYLLEYLKHPMLLSALGISLSLGMLLSIPFDAAGFLAPQLVFATGSVLGMLYVPGMSSFQEGVDAKYRDARRESIITPLLNEINRRSNQDVSQKIFNRFWQLWDRVLKLTPVAEDENHSFGLDDLMRVESAAIQYLRMNLALLLLNERRSNLDLSMIRKQRATTEQQLSEVRDPIERAKLQKALANFDQLEDNSRKIEYRRSAISASLMALPDQIEEVYQLALLDTGSAHGGGLGDSLMRLKAAEEIHMELDDPSLFLETKAKTNKAPEKLREMG